MEWHSWFFDGLLGGGDWLLFACGLTAITALPLALRWVPPNRFYGFKTKFTLSDPAVWYAANAFMGRAMVAASIVSAAIIAYGPRYDTGGSAIALVMAPVAIATLAGLVYLRHLHETAQRR